jgi:starch synthase
MDIYHISAECYPVAKVGGLGDVVGALPKYQQIADHRASVVIPGYDNRFTQDNSFDIVHEGKLRLGHIIFDYRIIKESTNKLEYDLFLVTIPGLFDRPEVYSYDDDTERFTAFQIAVLNWFIEAEIYPDIVHCHDHHTGLIPFMMRCCYNYSGLDHIPTVITIHNGQYQGWFSFSKLHYIPRFNLSQIGLIEWDNVINPLASAIKCAWRVTTVSESYLNEISYSANGLENLLQMERAKSVGILNGIDTEVWNPKTDSFIKANFTSRSFKKGKRVNKDFLCAQFNMDPTKPLFAFIGRLVGEKGADLLPDIIYTSFKQHLNQINILVLGSGDNNIEHNLQSLTSDFQGNYNAYIGYNEGLSHIIYAGADFLLMPSRVEPCGLNQMYAMRYGTIPIVRRTGGLQDTVIDIGDGGFGFCHNTASVDDVVYSIDRAFQYFHNSSGMSETISTIMGIDHSWDQVTLKYMDLYKSLKTYDHER